jgi:hypothetical protein
MTWLGWCGIYVVEVLWLGRCLFMNVYPHCNIVRTEAFAFYRISWSLWPMSISFFFLFFFFFFFFFSFKENIVLIQSYNMMLTLALAQVLVFVCDVHLRTVLCTFGLVFRDLSKSI